MFAFSLEIFPPHTVVLRAHVCDAPIKEGFHVFSFNTEVARQHFLVLDGYMGQLE
jgi:hypothetical protein